MPYHVSRVSSSATVDDVRYLGVEVDDGVACRVEAVMGDGVEVEEFDYGIPGAVLVFVDGEVVRVGCRVVSVRYSEGCRAGGLVAAVALVLDELPMVLLHEYVGDMYRLLREAILANSLVACRVGERLGLAGNPVLGSNGARVYPNPLYIACRLGAWDAYDLERELLEYILWRLEEKLAARGDVKVEELEKRAARLVEREVEELKQLLYRLV